MNLVTLRNFILEQQELCPHFGTAGMDVVIISPIPNLLRNYLVRKLPTATLVGGGCPRMPSVPGVTTVYFLTPKEKAAYRGFGATDVVLHHTADARYGREIRIDCARGHHSDISIVCSDSIDCHAWYTTLCEEALDVVAKPSSPMVSSRPNVRCG